MAGVASLSIDSSTLVLPRVSPCAGLTNLPTAVLNVVLAKAAENVLATNLLQKQTAA